MPLDFTIRAFVSLPDREIANLTWTVPFLVVALGKACRNALSTDKPYLRAMPRLAAARAADGRTGARSLALDRLAVPPGAGDGVDFCDGSG